MGKKSRLKKEVLLNTTQEQRRASKAERRERINAKESQVEWIEKKGGNPEVKYHRGYIACWKDKARYAIRAQQADGSVREIIYPPVLRGTFALNDRMVVAQFEIPNFDTDNK